MTEEDLEFDGLDYDKSDMFDTYEKRDRMSHYKKMNLNT